MPEIASQKALAMTRAEQLPSLFEIGGYDRSDAKRAAFAFSRNVQPMRLWMGENCKGPREEDARHYSSAVDHLARPAFSSGMRWDRQRMLTLNLAKV